jgi:hypothetical protein
MIRWIKWAPIYILIQIWLIDSDLTDWFRSVWLIQIWLIDSDLTDWFRPVWLIPIYRIDSDLIDGLIQIWGGREVRGVAAQLHHWQHGAAGGEHDPLPQDGQVSHSCSSKPVQKSTSKIPV